MLIDRDQAAVMWRTHALAVLGNMTGTFPALPVVKRLVLKDPYEIFHVLKEAEFNTMLRRMEPGTGWYWVTPVPVPGQELRWPNMNLRVIFEPNYTATQMTVLELGCDHDFDKTGSRNCYHVATCTKCKYAYAIDSGD